MPEHHPGKPCVGVLFVHGAGVHPKGGTLLGHAGPLANWLDRWYSDGDPTRSGTEIGPTRLLDTDGSNEPAHAVIRFEADGATHEWLLAESWWDASYSEPGFRDVLRWSLVIAPWMLITQLTIPVVDSFRQDLRGGFLGALRFGWVLLRSFVLTVVGVPLVQLLSLVLLLMSVIPVGQVRSAIGTIQRWITSAAGDLYLVLTSPMQRAALATRVRHDVDWLRNTRGAKRVVVVSHSQGGFVAYEALSGPWAPAVDGLVTYGSGLVRLVEADRVARRGLLLPVALTASLGILGGIRYVVPSLAGYFGFGRVPEADTIPTVLAWLFLAIGVVFPIRYAIDRRQDSRIAPLGQVGQWDDYLSAHDPVLRGSMRDWLPDQATRREVHNGGSSLSDHSAYWDNVDEFVTQVTRDVARQDGVVTSAFDDASINAVSLRRQWRERTLRIGSTIVGFFTLVLVVAGTQSAGDLGGEVVDQARRAAAFLGADLSARPMQLLLELSPVPIALGMLALVGVLVSRLVRLIWEAWTRAEIAAFFRREEPGSGAGGQIGIIAITILFSIAVILAALPGRDNVLAAVVGATAVSLPSILGLAAAMLGSAFLVGVILVWTRLREHPVWGTYPAWTYGAIPAYLVAAWLLALYVASGGDVPAILIPVLGVATAALLTVGAPIVVSATGGLFRDDYARFVRRRTAPAEPAPAPAMEATDAWAVISFAWSLVLLYAAVANTMRIGDFDIGAGVALGYLLVPLYGAIGVAAGSRTWVRILCIVTCALVAVALVVSLT